MSCLPHLGQISFLPTGPSASLSPTGSPISRAKLSNASSAAPVCPLTANSARCLSTASRARALSRTSSGCSRAARIAPARAFASSVRRFAALRPPKAPISAALSEVCSRETILPVSGSFVILKPRSSISPPHSIRTPNRSPCLSFFDIADQRQVKLLGQPAHDLIPLIYNHPPSASRLHQFLAVWQPRHPSARDIQSHDHPTLKPPQHPRPHRLRSTHSPMIPQPRADVMHCGLPRQAFQKRQTLPRTSDTPRGIIRQLGDNLLRLHLFNRRRRECARQGLIAAGLVQHASSDVQPP